MKYPVNPLTLSRLSADADYMYPCFKMEDVERALARMTRKLGFYRADVEDLPAVFTFEYDDLRLVVMTTPKVFYNDRLCYALSGVLIKNDDWTTEIESLGKEADQDISTWRNHPKDFYQDLLNAVANLRPDMWLPEGQRKLLGPATAATKPAPKQLTCFEWTA